MSGNTPAELIERSNDLIADLQVHAWDDCGGQPPDSHIAIQAADQLTVLTGLIGEALKIIDKTDDEGYSPEIEDELEDWRARTRAALTGEKG